MDMEKEVGWLPGCQQALAKRLIPGIHSCCHAINGIGRKTTPGMVVGVRGGDGLPNENTQFEGL